MKKVIVILLCLAMLFSMAACGKSETTTNNKPSNPSGNNQSSQQGSEVNPDNSNAPDESSNQGNEPPAASAEFKYEDVDVEAALKQPTIKEVKTPYNSTVKLLVSPLEFDDDTVIAGFKQAEMTKDLTFYCEESEKGDSVHVINTEDVWTQYSRHHYLKGCAPGANSIWESNVNIYVRYEPSVANGPTVVECEFENIDTSDVEKFQRQAEEVLTYVFGKDLAHALVYVKYEEPNEKEGLESYFYKKSLEYQDGDEQTRYSVVREASVTNYSGFVVRYAIYVGSSVYNYFDHFHEDYVSAISQMPLDLNEVFSFKAGKIDLNNPKDTLVPYLSVAGQEPYQYTFLDEYDYECTDNPSGITELSLEVGFEKNANLPNARMNIEMDVELDKNNNNELKSMNLKLSGFPDQISSSDWKTYYPEMLPGLKEQLELVFGDGIDLSDFSIDKFETTYVDDGGHENKECSIPAKLTVCGKEVEGTVNIKLSDTFIDTLRAFWSFSVSINP